MKQFLISLLIILGLFHSGIAKPVDPNIAMQVGLNYINSLPDTRLISGASHLNLIYTSHSTEAGMGSTETNNYFYVFNIDQTKGFVIVAAIDDVIPILGYSDQLAFVPEKIPVNVANWLDGYRAQIKYIIDNKVSSNKEIDDVWSQLRKGKLTTRLNKKSSVGPLLQTQWNQSTYYNEKCPYDNTAGTRTLTGCVATAMAQVMKYWNYPETGTGFHSYKHSKYGTLSANFSSTAYNWKSMPDNLSKSNDAVATLMYHCGVSVDMSYGPNSSGAYVISSQSATKYCVEYALKTYFAYKTSLKGVIRAAYPDTAWIKIMKTELDAKRPILYAGFTNQSGHAFINDGYNNAGYFHFDWGWGGSYNGYFTINTLNPTSGYRYNENQYALIGIEPREIASGKSKLGITKSVSLDSSSGIKYGSPFSVSCNVTNISTDTFRGKYCAAIFDKNDFLVEIIDSIEEKNGLAPNANYKSDLKFNHKSSSNLLPGNYTIYILYKTAENGWQKVFSTNLSIYDYAMLEVSSSCPLALYSKPMTLTPSEFVSGEPGYVNFSVINFGSKNYSGPIRMSLYNLDGTHAETIGSFTVSGLSPGNYYPSIIIKSSFILSTPGTYLLVLEAYSGIANIWHMVSNVNYPNPMKINVVKYSPNPDRYEINDSLKYAYKVPFSFVDDLAQQILDSASCHISDDIDYYKLELPAGFSYNVSAKLVDFPLIDNNAKQYSLDANFSYTLDGGNSWSKTFDNVLNGTINMAGGGSIYFLVTSKLLGETGSYKFELSATRTVNLKSSAAKITGFTVPGIVGKATIDTINTSVYLTVSSSTDITALSPTISISKLAGINPASGVKRNFTNPLIYTVTAENGALRKWNVTVTKQPASAEGQDGMPRLRIFPNPAFSYISLPVINPYDDLTYSIIDLTGRIIQSGLVNPKINLINIETLVPGVYYLRLGVQPEIYKLIKE